MAMIAKSYYISHIPKLVIKVSSWKRPFDDLYDALNGELNSENLSSNFTVNSCQITVSSTAQFSSATTLREQLLEALPKGYHDLHFYVYGGESGSFPSAIGMLSIFPGRAEVNGSVVRVKERLNIRLSSVAWVTASKVLFNATGTFSAVHYFGVFLNNTPIITASDIFLQDLTTSASSLYGTNKTGLYSNSSTSSKRAFYTFALTSFGSWVEDNEFLTPPVTPHSYLLPNSEAYGNQNYGGLGYWSSTGLGTQTSGGSTSAIYRHFNATTWRYDYQLIGRVHSSTLTQWIFGFFDGSETRAKRFVYNWSGYWNSESYFMKNSFYRVIAGATSAVAEIRLFQNQQDFNFVCARSQTNTFPFISVVICDNMRTGMITNG